MDPISASSSSADIRTILFAKNTTHATHYTAKPRTYTDNGRPASPPHLLRGFEGEALPEDQHARLIHGSNTPLSEVPLQASPFIVPVEDNRGEEGPVLPFFGGALGLRLAGAWNAIKVVVSRYPSLTVCADGARRRRGARRHRRHSSSVCRT